MGYLFENREDVAEKTGFFNVNAEHLGQLVQHDDTTDTGLEARQHRVGNKTREKSQPQDPGQQQQAKMFC